MRHYRLLAAALLCLGLAAPALAQNEDPGTQPSTPGAPAPKGKKRAVTPPSQPDSGSPSTPGAPGAPTGAPGGTPAPGTHEGPGAAAPAPAPFSPPPPSLPHGPGPWDNDLLVATIPAAAPLAGPGASEKSTPDFKVFDRGGVASLTREPKGRLIAAYQWFPQNNPQGFDKVAVRFSNDEGRTWSGPKTTVVIGMPTGAMRPCDPTLVTLPDGRIRMYFTSSVPHEKPATYSAISPAGDGLIYTFEPGARFADPAHEVLDCTVARLGDTWHYYAPVHDLDDKGRARTYHATSTDGLKFERQPDISLDAPNPKSTHHRWLGCALASSDSKSLRFFGTNDGAPGIWIAHSTNGADWRLDESPIKSGVDPAAIELKDGSLLVIATGPPRPGTASTKPHENHDAPRK